MTVFFTSDTHFGHAAILRYCNRPFSSIEEHDEALIERWNAVVGPKDEVWHLGDFAFHHGRGEETARIFRRLRGRKHLIIGNHEPRSKATLRLPWAEPPAHYREISFAGQRIILFHYAMRTWNACHHGSLALFGHSHGKMPGNSQSLDVGVDAWDYRPVTLDEIKQRMATLPPFTSEDYHKPRSPIEPHQDEGR